MVSESIHQDLLIEGKKIIYVGDYGQLPPVNSYFNLMKEKELDYKLTKIHRQAENSGILQLAYKARKGHPLNVGVYGEDKSAIVNDSIKLSSLINADQIICGKNDTRKKINELYRKEKGFANYGNTSLYAGEKIIVNNNNKSFGVYNGQQFIVLKTYGVKWGKKMLVMEPHHFYAGDYELKKQIKQYPEELVKTFPFEFSDKFNKKKVQIDYGYAITAHKSQGSEWEKVVVFDEKYCFGNNSKKWLYTAVTRASQKLIVVTKFNITGDK